MRLNRSYFDSHPDGYSKLTLSFFTDSEERKTFEIEFIEGQSGEEVIDNLRSFIESMGE